MRTKDICKPSHHNHYYKSQCWHAEGHRLPLSAVISGHVTFAWDAIQLLVQGQLTAPPQVTVTINNIHWKSSQDVWRIGVLSSPGRTDKTYFLPASSMRTALMTGGWGRSGVEVEADWSHHWSWIPCTSDCIRRVSLRPRPRLVPAISHCCWSPRSRGPRSGAPHRRAQWCHSTRRCFQVWSFVWLEGWRCRPRDWGWCCPEARECWQQTETCTESAGPGVTSPPAAPAAASSPAWSHGADLERRRI